MAASRKPSQDKSSKYAIAASKGFSYYLPKSAQQDLQALLKQLPSPARSVYNEYYRDVMCAKACAAESAAATAKFATESFPAIARTHNAFARKMNAEIDSDEHEGFVPVMFPIVPEPEVRIGEEESSAATGRSVKRKRAAASTTMLSSPGDASNKKAKTKTDARSTARRGSEPIPRPSPPPTHVPDADVPSTRPQPNSTIPSTNSVERHTDDAPSPTPDSTHGIDAKEEESPAHPVRQPQPTSPRPNEPSTPDPSISDATFPSPEQASHHDPLVHNTTPSPSTPQPPNTSPPQRFKPPTIQPEHRVPQTPNSLANPTDATTPTSTFFSEEQSWREGMHAIETFPWDRQGSRWVSGRGVVSVYDDDDGGDEESAAVFRGDYWDEGDE